MREFTDRGEPVVLGGGFDAGIDAGSDWIARGFFQCTASLHRELAISRDLIFDLIKRAGARRYAVVRINLGELPEERSPQS